MADDYQRITEAISYLREHAQEQPSLDDLAEYIGLSPYHFQRLFHRFAGVSPKRFLQHLTTEHAKQLLRRSTSVLETSFEVGLSSPGRLHDLLISVEAVTPGEYKTGGENLQIIYGSHPSPFGECLIATTERGICRLNFFDGNLEQLVDALRQDWPMAEIRRDDLRTTPLVEQIFARHSTTKTLPLLLRGTNFQLQVWQALLKIPVGMVTSYGFLAKHLGQPSASRAVGSAVGKNPLGYLIPCHRVLRSDGNLGGYRWGTERKLAILGRELACQEV